MRWLRAATETRACTVTPVSVTARIVPETVRVPVLVSLVPGAFGGTPLEKLAMADGAPVKHARDGIHGLGGVSFHGTVGATSRVTLKDDTHTSATVYYLARRGELPASRLGRTWRFLRPRIERLLEE